MTIKIEQHKQLVWDLPTRLFHWTLLILVCLSFYTGLNGGFDEMDCHMWSGYFVLTILVFRVIWGFVAQGNARFNTFVKGPANTLAYLKGHSSRNPATTSGHNPVGAVSVLLMLTALLIQALSGLFANDDIMLEGPLVHLVSSESSRILTSIHHYGMWLVGLLAGLHIAAVFYHLLAKKQNLILPMISGRQLLSEEQEHPTVNQLILATIAFLSCAVGVYFLITYV